LIDIAGGGPAGAAAAIAALGEGASVRIFEESAWPRHKVCGEFLSPEAGPLLEALGVATDGARIGRIRLRVGRRAKMWRLEEPALGISRYRLDHALLVRAAALGAELRRERTAVAQIIACGRRARRRGEGRLFGFKAHFAGPADDALDLFVTPELYAGVAPVEGGAVNVCGVAREDRLKACGFEPDGLIAPWISGLGRRMDWLFTGPLELGAAGTDSEAYRAGDALGFIDPFTGSGILAALWTGREAGRAAARGVPTSDYKAACQRGFARQYRVARLLRGLIAARVAEWLAPVASGSWLFRLTRPAIIK
jgi:flavin-dependent dehydrogenase